MKIFHTLCISPLPSGIDKTPDRKTGDNDHHTAPEQIGEDVSKCAVKHAQRNTDQGRHSGPSCTGNLLSSAEESVLQHGEKMTLATQPNSDT